MCKFVKRQGITNACSSLRIQSRFLILCLYLPFQITSITTFVICSSKKKGIPEACNLMNQHVFPWDKYDSFVSYCNSQILWHYSLGNPIQYFPQMSSCYDECFSLRQTTFRSFNHHYYSKTFGA